MKKLIEINKKVMATGAENKLNYTIRKTKLKMIGIEAGQKAEISENIINGELIIKIKKA